MRSGTHGYMRAARLRTARGLLSIRFTWWLLTLQAFLPFASYAAAQPTSDLADLVEETRRTVAELGIDSALAKTTEIERVLRSATEPEEKIDALGLVTEIYRSAGKRGSALRSLSEAVNVSAQIKDATRSVARMKEIALQFRSLGARSDARSTIRAALLRAQDNHAPAGERAGLQNDLGVLYGELDDPQSAAAAFDSALELTSPDDHGQQFRYRLNLLKASIRGHVAGGELKAQIADADRHLGQLSSRIEGDQARLELAAALLLDHRLNEQTTFLGTADSYLQRVLGDTADAVEFPLRSHLLGDLGYIQMIRGNEPAALEWTRRALLASARAGESERYLWHWQLARIYARQGDRARSIQQYDTAVASLTDVSSKISTAGKLGFKENIFPLFQEDVAMLVAAAEASNDAAARADLLRRARSAMERFNTSEVLEYFNDDCIVPPVHISVDDIAPDTAVIYPIPLKDRLVLLVHMQDGLHLYSVDVGQAELADIVGDFRVDLEEVSDDVVSPAEQLYDWLVRPYEPQLEQQGVSTLVFVPSGGLRTIPPAALYDGKRYLLERYRIVNSLGLDLTAPLPLGKHATSLLLGGISDERPGFSPLPSVQREISEIYSIAGGDELLNQDMTFANLSERMSEGGYSVIHLATHGYFDEEPAKSFLLVYDDRFSMESIQESVGRRRGSAEPIELLVLSACQTALGNERAALGLAGVSLKAGARSTVASLWSISDVATSRIMVSFYKNLVAAMPKAEALRQAQLQLLSDPVYSHPNFWSPFLLTGNWL